MAEKEREKGCIGGNKEQQVDGTRKGEKHMSGVKHGVEPKQMLTVVRGTAASSAGGPVEEAATGHFEAAVRAQEHRTTFKNNVVGGSDLDKDTYTDTQRERQRERERERERERAL